MAGRREKGIADDAASYEDVGVEEAGIAEDAASFQSLLEETSSDEVRALDSPWLYESDGAVFGPVPAREVLELLYSGEINPETPVAPETGEFQPLRRFGAFRSHLGPAARVLEERREAEARARREAEAQRSRRLRWMGLALVGLLLGSSLVYGLVWWRRSAVIEAERMARERQLEAELARLLEGVSIEPPLMPLVEGEADSEPPERTGDGRTRRPKRERHRMKVSGRRSGPLKGTLTDREVVSGVQRVFGKIVTCIKAQLRRNKDSVPETVVLTFGINNRGRAIDVRITDRHLRRSPLSRCVEVALKRARWRAYKGEVRNVEYPIGVRRPE